LDFALPKITQIEPVTTCNVVVTV